MRILLVFAVYYHLLEPARARDMSLVNVLLPDEHAVEQKEDNTFVATDTNRLRAAMRGELTLPVARLAHRELFVVPEETTGTSMRIEPVSSDVKSRLHRRVAKGVQKRKLAAKDGVGGINSSQMNAMRMLKGFVSDDRRAVAKVGKFKEPKLFAKRNLKKLAVGSKDVYNRIAKRQLAGGMQKSKQQRKQVQARRMLGDTSYAGTLPAGVELQKSDEDTKAVEPMTRNASFDFVVGGFPKCGTTTLLKAFGKHPEIDIAATEQCSIASPGQADTVVLRKLDETITELSNEPSVKRSFKCPTAMYNYKSIVRMKKHSPNAKFVVGVRHPIKMLQSFYNYRVTEIYERSLEDQELIPDFTELIESGLQWKGVSSASVRFELFLTQLGKTAVTQQEMLELSQQHYDLAIKPSNFTVFLYSVDQLEDTDEARAEKLRSTLQQYLLLDSPLSPFGHENKNHAVGATGHKESINICDDKYKAMRTRMIAQGLKSASWIKDHFITSPDVVVPNEEHFVETLRSWSQDPCEGVVKSS